MVLTFREVEDRRGGGGGRGWEAEPAGSGGAGEVGEVSWRRCGAWAPLVREGLARAVLVLGGSGPAGLDLGLVGRAGGERPEQEAASTGRC